MRGSQVYHGAKESYHDRLTTRGSARRTKPGDEPTASGERDDVHAHDKPHRSRPLISAVKQPTCRGSGSIT